MEEDAGGMAVYESSGILSEMFNFPSAAELLDSQIPQSYRNPRLAASDWFLHRQNMAVDGGLGDSKSHEVVDDTASYHHHSQQHQISSMNNADSAAAMQLFLMNPQRQKSPSPFPSVSPSLHLLLPNHPSSSFHTASDGAFGQFTWLPNSGNANNPNQIQGQGLSLSLSSSLEAAKAEELRVGEGGMLFSGSAPAQYQLKSGGSLSQSRQPSFNILRNSKYAKAAQELLEEFCSVGRGQYLKKNKSGRQENNRISATSKDLPPLSASNRLDHQRRKVKLLTMLDELERRYNHYCEQMQMVVNSFDMIMGYAAAAPYTSLAQKAMSRHFRCLKDAVAGQLKQSCEQLGEEGGASGLTKGETPRLKMLEQSLRQQRALNQTGMMEQEAWRPQRGLPERSVNVLRAWLFEHFLHPYPSDADKHVLARQTGLSRNQVSNWFINARVRLWKPMVEEMYVEEFKQETQQPNRDQTSSSPAKTAQTPTPPHPTTTTAFTSPDSDPSLVSVGGRKHPVRFGDVSLTLGLQHAPEKPSFPVADFGSC